MGWTDVVDFSNYVGTPKLQPWRPPPPAPPWPRWRKFLTTLTAVAAIGLPLWVLYVLGQPQEIERRPAACAKALKSIGWKPPARLDEEACTEIESSIFATAWTGTFHMPRADVRDWLTGLPSRRDGPPVLSGESAPQTFFFVPPSAGRIDTVEVSVTWRGEADAVISFKTYNG
ncbi:hypothetical protein [Streptomyces sp. NPDC085540]|uniref:hypothetical protein n=1 Tax=Streptomyces sp. NPDC085540 TaxID=3365730 RepID=UPI0037D66194